MKKNKLKQRVFDTRSFFLHLKNMMCCIADFRHMRKSGNVNKAFAEKIMLAVTEVNGCRYCNYIHTRNAINAGVSEEDIQILLDGQYNDLSPDELHALMFAQHYADTGGCPDSNSYQIFRQYYGEEKTRDIIAIIKTIMVANIYGLSIEAILNRIKGNSLPGSKLKDEIFIIFGILLFVPVICVQLFFNRVLKLPAMDKRY